MTDDFVNLSALNQYAYCPRRCGLIYQEGEFEDNLHTARGNAEHARVDHVDHAVTREGARIEHALPVWSDRIGLIGKCDVVEFWPDGTVYPVEYKHGPKRKWLNDDLQLAGQALCLEEMFARPVAHGAIYHVSSRRRREIELTSELRQQVEETAVAIRTLVDSGALPAPLNDARCRECSLNPRCQPVMLGAVDRQRILAQALFEATP
jgi:CRISPR-associated exonuclease Cas4